MRLVWGSVQGVRRLASGIQELDVKLPGAEAGNDVAICYPELSGECAEGDEVLLNTTAVDLMLGTGGRHFVVARAGSGVALDDPSRGHIMKLRYTPLQRDVLAVESPESPHHGVMASANSLAGMPVVCCGLHSHVPLVAAAAKHANASLKIAYCMTDSGSLALALSDNVRAGIDTGLLDATITCGQAFGGQLEAVNVHSGLLAARHVVRADVAIVAIGPGVVGTTTPLGHGGVAQGEAINAVASLGGSPVAVLRMSFADARARHRVVSHHTLTALSRIALAEAIVPVPLLPDDLAEKVDEALEESGIASRHRCVTAAVSTPPDLRGIRVSTMGRGP
ncbi:MAG: DUF3866 family protein, partial [Actinomycetota bacterium]|nr:DUF3866 family protein [Actinomycetota bacterium]